jgi:hypothetical protein
MIRSIVVAASALVVATSAQAVTLAPVHQPDRIVTQVRMGCGSGMIRVNGVCVTPSAITASSGGPGARALIGMEAHAGGKNILGVAIVEARQQRPAGR